MDNVSVDFQPGELVAIVGENGAGKSSLMNTLAGFYQPDRGEIFVAGRQSSFSSPREAIRHGIGMVHQHFMLVPSLTVAENLALGSEPSRGGLLDREAMRLQLEQICARVGFKLDPDQRVEALTIGSQQKLEIVKVLHREARVIILDEPTAVLTPLERQELFRTMRKLAAEGRTLLFVTHRLAEVLDLADRVMVMRRGKMVTQLSRDQITIDALTAAMIGKVPDRPEQAASGPDLGPKVLELDGLGAAADSGRPALRGVSLNVHGGEVVGVAGVDGNGQLELAQVIAGLRPIAAGTVRILGKAIGGSARRRPAEIGYVPDDRLSEAVIGSMSLEENLALGRQREPCFARGPWIDFEGRRLRAGKLIAEYEIRPADPEMAIGRFSGGNQQKLVLAREMDRAPRLLVASQPTQGLDLAAAGTVHRRLRQIRESGGGVLLISLDLEELLHLSDRLYVLFQGKLTGELARENFDEHRIGRMMVGRTQ